MEIAKYEFKESAFLTDDEIADVIARAPQFIEWLNSITEYAQKKALEGKTWPGFKLVEGQSRRKWLLDESDVADTILERMPEISEDQIYDMKLKSISQVEKVVGKKRFENILSDIVVKPQGKPTLVSIDDKRPALGIEDAINDFK